MSLRLTDIVFKEPDVGDTVIYNVFNHDRGRFTFKTGRVDQKLFDNGYIIEKKYISDINVFFVITAHAAWRRKNEEYQYRRALTA